MQLWNSVLLGGLSNSLQMTELDAAVSFTGCRGDCAQKITSIISEHDLLLFSEIHTIVKPVFTWEHPLS